MEEEDNIIVKWSQEDVETSYSLLNINKYFNKCRQYQIWRKSVHWDPIWYLWKDRHDEANRRSFCDYANASKDVWWLTVYWCCEQTQRC